MPRLTMSRPWSASAVARASTAKAFSSPMREKAGTRWSMVVVLTFFGPFRGLRAGSSALGYGNAAW
ncbi:MAG: hypothetical protein AVDCRST_MAG90-3173 [uncultured Microvirga sp.]|uniref:Uncharacterized protein n=1 Tax=uncultured Microvirga sp. TaxID=412392 RepID=A0A6J4MLT4_9HYPH|nr:MAG: hypothetical protein AVDCRST_MAG90-3173 [uncultured Microvirga sp.]